jgi:hypothetical protein
MLLRLNLLLLATLAWTACENSSGNADIGNGMEDAPVASGDTLAGDDLGADQGGGADHSNGDGTSGRLPDMTGIWAQWEVGASITQVPVLGEVHTQGVAIMRWVVTQNGGTLAIQQELCTLLLISDSELAATIVPDAFIASVPLMDKTGSVEALGASFRFTMDLTPELFGVDLVDPLNDLLPTTADDPRVIDQDGDGHPGMTVFITGMMDGAAYVVQRNLRTLDGTFVSDDRIEGLVDWNQEQNVIDSDNEILAANPPSSITDPDPEKSPFVAVRIPEDWDCASLLARQDELFPQL